MDLLKQLFLSASWAIDSEPIRAQGIIVKYSVLEIILYIGYKSANRFMDDAQRRTIANELQKPNYDHLICYLFGKVFLAANTIKYVIDRLFMIYTEWDFPSVYSSLLSN